MNSYNDIEQYRKKRRQKKLIRQLLTIVVVISIFFVVYYIGSYINLYGDTPSYTAGISKPGYPISLEADKPISLNKFGNTLSILTEKRLLIYSTDGREIMNVIHDYSNPMQVNNDKYVIIYDQGGKAYKIISKNKILKESEITENIQNIIVDDSGYFAITKKADRYAGAVTIYDSKFNEILTWYSSDDMIVNIGFKGSKKGCYVSAYKASQGKFLSTIYELDFNKKQEINKIVIEDTLAVELYEYDNNSYNIITDNMLINTKDHSIQKKYNYNLNLSKYYISSNKKIIMYFGDNTVHQKDLVVFNIAGEIESQITITDKVKDIVSDDKYIYILTGAKIFKYNYNFKLISSEDIQQDCEQIIAISKNIYCLGKSEVAKITLN